MYIDGEKEKVVVFLSIMCREGQMKNAKGVFRNLERMIMQSGLFGDDWNIYNRGEYLQLYKDGWYNHTQGGIHFETYIETREIKNK